MLKADTTVWRLSWAMLGTWCLVCAASYVVTDLPRNDFERFDAPWLSAAFLALFTALLVFYAAVVERADAFSPRLVWLGFTAFAVPLLVSFPVGSKDIFSYVFFGKMWAAYGANPNLAAPAEFSADPWLRLVLSWPSDPSRYGPLFTLQMRAIYAAAGGDLTAAVALQKGLSALLVAASAWLIARLAEAARGEAGGVRVAALLWLWSPLVLFESIGSGHSDVAVAALILAAALLWVRDRPAGAAAVLALSVWYKWYGLFLVPLWALWSLRRWGWSARLLAAPLAAAAVSVPVLLPFAGSIGAMLARTASLGAPELLPDEMPPPLWLLFRFMETARMFDSPLGLKLFDGCRVAALLGGYGWLLWRRRRSVYSAELFLTDTLLALCLFFGALWTILWPWYLLPVLALALATGGRAAPLWALWLSAAGLLSYFLTFAYAVAACAAVAAVVAWLRRRPVTGS